jgi:hypothetical protein
MPVIRITDATWDRLKRWAIPLEDSTEDAIRKVLDAAEDHLKCGQTIEKGHIEASKQTRKKLGKLSKGKKTPQQAYRRPILEALAELGGRAPVDDVLKLVEKKIKSTLIDVDYEKLPSGIDIRWRNTAMWERFNLVKDGLMKSDSRSGIWEISSEGVKKLKEQEI